MSTLLVLINVPYTQKSGRECAPIAQTQLCLWPFGSLLLPSPNP
jgi:hypothetical protein